MSSFADGALGGYFELELPPAPNPLYPQALAYQSARAAFQALLTAGNPGRVWIPRFICDEMIAWGKKQGVKDMKELVGGMHHELVRRSSRGSVDPR